MNIEVWLFFSLKDFFLPAPVIWIQFLSDVKRELDKLSDFLQRHLGGGSGSRTFTITKEEKTADRQASRGAGELSTAYVSTLRSTIEQLLQVRSIGLFSTFPSCKILFSSAGTIVQWLFNWPVPHGNFVSRHGRRAQRQHVFPSSRSGFSRFRWHGEIFLSKNKISNKK